MDDRCEACDRPLDAPGFNRCPACLIEDMAAGARSRLENEPWERLPEHWKRIADGWADFPEEFRDELRHFVADVYDERRSAGSRRASSTLLRVSNERPPPDDPASYLERIEADLEEWSA